MYDDRAIPHIFARTAEDAYRALGYVVARDRLFQLELWRRQATGTMAEILGPRELKRDIGARLFMFRKDLTQELSYYHPHGAAIVDAFVAGVNAAPRPFGTRGLPHPTAPAPAHTTPAGPVRAGL